MLTLTFCYVQGSLVAIRGPRTSEFVNRLAGGQVFYTGGLRFEEGRDGFWWINDLKYDFPKSYFYDGQPNNHLKNEYCVVMNYHASQRFSDGPCDIHRPFVCEKNAHLS